MDAIGGNLADTFIPGHAASSILKKMQAAKQGPKPDYPTMDTDPGGMKVPGLSIISSVKPGTIKILMK